jgi:hypothetical protein
VLISQCFPIESAEAINRYMHTHWSFIDSSLAVSFALVWFGFIRNRNRLVTASQYYFGCLTVLTATCIISIKFILLCFTLNSNCNNWSCWIEKIQVGGGGGNSFPPKSKWMQLASFPPPCVAGPACLAYVIHYASLQERQCWWCKITVGPYCTNCCNE